jgi:hypothetical protein
MRPLAQVPEFMHEGGREAIAGYFECLWSEMLYPEVEGLLISDDVCSKPETVVYLRLLRNRLLSTQCETCSSSWD